VNQFERERKRRIDSYYRIDKVLEILSGRKIFRDIILCPFHEETNPSAKIYHDLDGDRIFCYAESRQYTVTDLLMRYKQNLDEWDPQQEVERVSLNEGWDVTPLQGFKDGEFDMIEFSKRLFRLGRMR